LSEAVLLRSNTCVLNVFFSSCAEKRRKAFQDDNGGLRLNSRTLFGPMHVMVFLFTCRFVIVIKVKIKMSLCSPRRHVYWRYSSTHC